MCISNSNIDLLIYLFLKYNYRLVFRKTKTFARVSIMLNYATVVN